MRRKKKKESSSRCPPKNSLKETRVDPEPNPSLQTPGPQENPGPQKTPDHQETAGHQEIPCSHKTSGLQMTTGSQDIPDPEETPGPQRTPGSQKTPDPEETPFSQKTPGPQETPSPQETPGSKKTPDPEATLGSQKTLGPPETPGPLKTPNPQNALNPQKTPSPLKTPDSQKTPSPQKTPDSQKTPSPQKTPGLQETASSQKTAGPEETPGFQKTPGSLQTQGPRPQHSQYPEETLCSSQLRISQCDDAQPVSWMTPDDGPIEVSNLEESPLLPPTAVLIPCRQREPCQTDGVYSSAAPETSITDTVQSSVIEPATQCAPCVFSVKLPDISELSPVITDISFTDKSNSPGISKESERSLVDPSVPEKSNDHIKEEEIIDNEVTSNSCEAEDIKETSLDGTCHEMAPCTLTNVIIKDGSSPGKEPQSDFPEFQAAQSEDVSLPKIPALPRTEQGRGIPDTVSQLPKDEGQNSPSMTNVSHLAEDHLQLQEWDVDVFQDQKTLTEPSMSPRLADKQTNLCALGEKEDVPLQGAESDHSRGAETVLEMPDSQLLGALEESLCHPEKNVDDAIAMAPVTSAPSVKGKLLYKALHANLRTNQSTPRGQPERREDASSTVRGLILELSNLNRLIMSTYRDLRQKRSRFPPGRGAAGKRRREK